MIIQARTRKKRHMGYTARNILVSGSRVPLKKFMEAANKHQLGNPHGTLGSLTPDGPSPTCDTDGDADEEVVDEDGDDGCEENGREGVPEHTLCRESISPPSTRTSFDGCRRGCPLWCKVTHQALEE